MDFTLDEEQTLAAQSLRELLVDQCTGTDLRRAAEAPDAAAFAAACATRAAALAGLGLAGALVPESQGGLGLQPVDLVAIAVEAGHAALPEPLLESAGVAMPLLAALAAAQPAAAAVLERALAGEALVLALAPGDAQLAALGAADFVLTGRDDTELVLHARGALSIRALASVDPLRRLGGLDAAAIVSEPLAALRGEAAATAWRAARVAVE